MIRSRRAAITSSLIGALLIAGVPTLAFGAGDSGHEAKAYSAASTSEDIAAQKAKDEDKDAKKADRDDAKKSDDKKAAEKKKAESNKKADDKKADNEKADNKKADGNKKADDNRKS